MSCKIRMPGGFVVFLIDSMFNWHGFGELIEIGITSVRGFIDCMNNLGDFLFSLDLASRGSA